MLNKSSKCTTDLCVGVFCFFLMKTSFFLQLGSFIYTTYILLAFKRKVCIETNSILSRLVD